jgi:hypothetical protein
MFVLARKKGYLLSTQSLVILMVITDTNLLLLVGFMTKCLSLDGLFQWAAALMVVDTTTTPTLLSVDVTALFLWTSTFLDALQLPRLFCMVFCSSKRRSTGARISFTGGPSEAMLVLLLLVCYISFPSTNL